MDRFLKILLVVEDRLEYHLIQRLLSQIHHTDYELTWVDLLDDALHEVLSEEADVILLDYHWRQGDCMHLLNGARAQGCRVPIIVMTDQMEAEVDRSAISHGASDYLIKGRIDSQLLERTLRYAIERKAAEQRLADLAHYDPLTGIPNRILFREKLEYAVNMARRDQTTFTLMYLDLDGFKQVNDSFGHDAGDNLLKICAERLSRCLRTSDSVARIGGDEFTLLLENIDSATDIAHIAQKVIDTLAKPVHLGAHQLSVGCSIGIAVFPDGGGDVDTLQKHADLAMYEAKVRTGSHYHFFSEALNLEAHRQLLLESELRAALKRDEFVLHYQPRIDLKSGQVMGLEALIRWQHPERGLIYPDQFMDVAEASGLIVPMGYWVMRTAGKALLRLRALLQETEITGVSDQLIMAINLSVRQFNDDKLVERIATLAKEEGFSPSHIELELTETALMENLDRIELCMRALAHLGCSFSLDDFGTGYSSFMHLQRLPISALKVDKGFVADICRRLEDAKLVSSMVTLAHSLNKTIIAEGVETSEQLAMLQQFGCDQVQGYHYCRPSSLELITEKYFSQLTDVSASAGK
ncbi:putative bifunctional diguanylate cyclase/phosphodiesterase [Pseudomaricurvus sp.]|uniref:putative bifunctional diguanylate cyclase/phosphodiesterase n=1 Tax=Pseudomaricurvus sp. TaxID=2004510 RepID=UPI003F6AE0BA